MTVILAGAAAAQLSPFVGRSHNFELVEHSLTPELLPRDSWLLISFGYRHILRRPVLEALAGRAINLHISMLPWNRGADPNLWSWLENTPKGVTVHWMVPGVDEGDVIAQSEVVMTGDETLRTSYARLVAEMIDQFASIWPLLESGADVPRVKQEGRGSTHRLRDKDPHLAALHSGWDTPGRDIAEYGRRAGLWLPGRHN